MLGLGLRQAAGRGLQSDCVELKLACHLLLMLRRPARLQSDCVELK